MSTRFVRRGSDYAAAYTGAHTGVGVSSTDNRLYTNVDGTKRAINASGYAKDLTAVTTLTAADSGATIYLNSATEFAVTLPTVAAGLVFTFVVKAAPSGASYTVVGASGTLLGHILSSQDAGGSGDSETTGGATFTFVDGKAVKGDVAVFRSDGTSWYITATIKVFDGATIT